MSKFGSKSLGSCFSSLYLTRQSTRWRLGSRQQKKQQKNVAGAEDATMADFADRFFKALKPLAASSCVWV